MMRDWYLPGYARAAISTGVGDGDSGLMPVLAIGFVAIRKLVLSAHWSEEDLAAVQGSAAFGPFCLVGRDFDAHSGTLSAPGVQIIGWFVAPLPVLPPLSDPALPAPDPVASVGSGPAAPAPAPAASAGAAPAEPVSSGTVRTTPAAPPVTTPAKSDVAPMSSAPAAAGPAPHPV
jgi:hypothetical protein